jgi:hypothetical protein
MRKKAMDAPRVSGSAVASLLAASPGLLYVVTRPIRIADWEHFEGPHHWWLDPVLALGILLSPVAIALGTAAMVRTRRRRRSFWSTIFALLGVTVSLIALSLIGLERFDRRHGRWGAPLPPGHIQRGYWWWH